MRLYLVRHGQTAWNAELRAQGQTDIPLDETGLAQAEALAKAVANAPIRVVYTSDLSRAAETARKAAEAVGAEIKVDERIRERSFGDYEGMTFSEFHPLLNSLRAEQAANAFTVRPPNGESLADVWDRLYPFAQEILATREPAMVVSHGGSCSLLLAILVRGTVESSRSFRFGNTGVTEMVESREGHMQIVRYNDISHLDGARALSGSIDGASR